MQMSLRLVPPSHRPAPTFVRHCFEQNIASNGAGQLWLVFKDGHVSYKLCQKGQKDSPEFEDYDYALARLEDLVR